MWTSICHRLIISLSTQLAQLWLNKTTLLIKVPRRMLTCFCAHISQVSSIESIWELHNCFVIWNQRHCNEPCKVTGPFHTSQHELQDILHTDLYLHAWWWDQSGSSGCPNELAHWEVQCLLGIMTITKLHRFSSVIHQQCSFNSCTYFIST